MTKPREWHPAYRDETWLLDWLKGPEPWLRIAKPETISLTADDDPIPVLTLTKRRAYRPAPFTGDPYIYRWNVATDDHGRSIASDAWIEYVAPKQVDRPRHIVVGGRGAVEQWRHRRGLSDREVIPACDRGALYGLVGRFVLVWLDNAHELPAADLDAICWQLEVIRARGGTLESWSGKEPW